MRKVKDPAVIAQIQQGIASRLPLSEILSRLEQAGFSVDDLNLISTGMIYQELEMDDAFLSIYNDRSLESNTTPLHSHSFYELLYCREAKIDYIIGSQTYKVRTGDLIFLPPGISHRPLYPKDMEKDYFRTVLWVNAAFFEELTAPFGSEGKPFSPPPILRELANQDPYTVTLLDRMLLEQQQKLPGARQVCKGCLMQLITLLFRLCQGSGSQAVPRKAELLNRCLAYMDRHLSEEITLEKIAKRFYVSPSGISLVFKKQMNTGFHQVLLQRRLIEAKLLISQGLPLKEIPEKCGFRDYSTFYRAFYRQFGISPREYRLQRTVSAADGGGDF